MVVGGGPAGCAAATAAAREGARTLLLEATGVLGGMGTSGLVPWFCGYGDGEKIIARGLAERVRLALADGMPHLKAAMDKKPHTAPAIDPELLKRIYDDMVTGAGAKVLFHSRLCSVELAGEDEVDALLVFHCVSAACGPSRYNYLTGHYGGRCPSESLWNRTKADSNGLVAGGGRNEPYNLFFNAHLDPRKERSLGHALRDAGYRTGHVGKWHVGASREDQEALPRFDPEDDPADPAVAARMRESRSFCRWQRPRSTGRTTLRPCWPIRT